MQTKHLYDSAEGLVLKSLRGAVALNSGLRLHEPSKTVFMNGHSPDKRVAVISGGGSGHEPAHAGYTGRGMLTASVAGDIFASPSAKQILTAIQLASRSGMTDHPPLDVLAIINNYTGDRLNFGLAIEKARASLPGVNIESVVVADDVSLLKQNANNKFVGPRGLAANILVCKILGALAETGEPLHVVKAFGDAVVGNLYSLGVGLDHCHVPGRARDVQSTLGERECEVGLGLHNEPGVAKHDIGEPVQLIDRMVEMVLAFQGEGGSSETLLQQCQEGIVLFINNLGGMSQLEMGAIVSDVINRFAISNIHPKRIYCSSYMTSLNAPGFSISVLNLAGVRLSLLKTNTHFAQDYVETLLDKPTDTFAWIGIRSSWPTPGMVTEPSNTLVAEPSAWKSKNKTESRSMGKAPTRIRNALRGACSRVLRIKHELTEFDTVVGDGDCGDTFSAGASAITKALDDNLLSLNQDVASIVHDIANLLEDNMGGTVGALFAIFLNGLAVALNTKQTNQAPISWGAALKSAKATLSRYTPAQIGDRTMMDALFPFCDTISAGMSIEHAVKEARAGAERTRGMQAHLGRAAYMSRDTKVDIPPDPGAWGVCAALEGFLDGLEE